MSRYRVAIRRTSTLEFEVEVEAEGQAQALRLAEDPAEWQTEVDYLRMVGDEEVDDIRAMSAEKMEEADE